MISLFGPRTGHRKDLVTLGVQGVVITPDRRVLLVRHSYRPGWHFPGGGVERGETLDHALKRELHEETGVVPSAPARLFGLYTHFDLFPGDHIALFVIESWRQDHMPAPNSEIAEQRFFFHDALPDDATPGSRRRMAEVFQNDQKSNRW